VWKHDFYNLAAQPFAPVMIDCGAKVERQVELILEQVKKALEAAGRTSTMC
jgi:enamine deaminase RidA (YjgF/YER057c/UK114 family)